MSTCSDDALVHAMEGHTSRFANPLTRMYTREALNLIGRYLLRAYRDGSDMQAREGMARAATIAGIGMTNSGLGAIHALPWSLITGDLLTANLWRF